LSFWLSIRVKKRPARVERVNRENWLFYCLKFTGIHAQAEGPTGVSMHPVKIIKTVRGSGCPASGPSKQSPVAGGRHPFRN